ncbi:MAG: TonB-dependent receptor [Chthoniobacterales bacterium]
MRQNRITFLATHVLAAFVAGASAHAQDAFTAPASGAPRAGAVVETERIVVTGSYIPTAETVSALPVTVYTADMLRKQGANTLAEGLRQLPSFVGYTRSENDSLGGTGAAFINLRGLGAENTLTLINGRRAFSFSNVNAIPIGALSRSEVLKDGASAIYGSDAVAGVVNMILLNGPGEEPYEGAEINLLYGNTTDGDARVLQGYIRGGVATEKVAIAAAAEYYDRANLYSRDREIAASADQRPLGGFNMNSPSFAGRVNVRGLGQLVLEDLMNNAPTPASYRSFDAAGNGTDPARFNFRAFTPAIPAVTKYQYYVTGLYNVFDGGLQLYGDLLYAKTKQDNGQAPSPLTSPQVRYANVSLGIFNGRNSRGIQDGSVDNSNAAQLVIIRNSPFNPFGAALNSVRYRFAQELNNRRDYYDFDYYRYVAGVKGKFTLKGNDFLSLLGYDSGVVYDYSDQVRTDRGDATRAGIYREIIAGNFNPFIGQNAPFAATVPTYLNGVPTGQTASYDNLAAVQRSSYLGKTYNYSRDYLIDGRIYGNLAPQLYQGGIEFNVGAEYRQSRSTEKPDPVELSGDTIGFIADAGVAFKTQQAVTSVFAELSIPLISSIMHVPGARSLEISVAYRHEQFEDKDLSFGTKAGFDNGGTPRVSLRYQPFADLTVRISYGQSFRSPTPDDLFAPPSQNFLTVSDPLVRGIVQPVNGIFARGNPSLKPELTDSYTAGLVFTPTFLRGFTTTIDLYQLYTTNVILDPFTAAQVIVSANGNAGGGPDAPFAQLIQRGDGPNGLQTGEIISADAIGLNASKRLVNGIDITADYMLPWHTLGTVNFTLGYNYFFTWKAEAFVGAGSTNFLGDVSLFRLPLAPGAIPYHKGFLRGEWQWKGIGFVATTNYISSFNDDSTALLGARQVGGGSTNPQFDIYRRVSDYITLDMQLSYEFGVHRKTAEVGAGKDTASQIETRGLCRRLFDRTRITAGVNNAFDRNPPTVLGAFNDNYDTSLYSIRNRYYYVSLNKKF